MNGSWRAVKWAKDDNGYFSVMLIREKKKKKNRFWVDISIVNEDVNCEWNQYIFYLSDPDEVFRQNVQDNNYEFEDATSTAIQFLVDSEVIYQDEKARWFAK